VVDSGGDVLASWEAGDQPASSSGDRYSVEVAEEQPGARFGAPLQRHAATTLWPAGLVSAGKATALTWPLVGGPNGLQLIDGELLTP
jgi:hypothetical protein